VSTANSARRFFFLLLAAATVLFALVVRPLASALFLAAALAGVMAPLHRRLSARFGRRPRLSAVALTLGVVLVLLLPLVAFSIFAIRETSDGVRFVSKTLHEGGVSALVDKLPGPARGLVHKAIDRLSGGDEGDLADTLQEHLGAQGGRAAAAVGATLSASGSLLFQTVMMLIAFYFLLLEGGALVDWIDDLSPLKRGQTRELLAEFKRVAYSVLLSAIVSGAAQAIVALGGFLIARVPHPIFFAGLTFFASFIPAVGAGIVCLAAAALLFVTGHPYGALFLALWGIAVVGLVDNAIKPLLVKSGMKMSGAVVFFALIGGLSAFGGVGLLLGPLVVTLFLSLLGMYQRDFRTPHATTTKPTSG